MVNVLFQILLCFGLLEFALPTRYSSSNQREIDRLASQVQSLTFQLEQVPTSCSPYANYYGVHTIRIPDWKPIQLFCNPLGWTVIQRRLGGPVDFNGNWNDYRDGFGYLMDEFFLGLEAIHRITAFEPHELYIVLTDHDNRTAYARYDNFAIGGEETGYMLKSLGTYEGTAGDSMARNVGHMFTTSDRDNDNWPGYNCAEQMKGGWWFSNCGKSNLNGPNEPDFGLTWHTWRQFKSIKFSEMMIRRKSVKF